MEDNIQVLARVRPLSTDELKAPGSRSVAVTTDSNTISIGGNKFCFDHCAGPDISQDGVFNLVGKPITLACLSG